MTPSGCELRPDISELFPELLNEITVCSEQFCDTKFCIWKVRCEVRPEIAEKHPEQLERYVEICNGPFCNRFPKYCVQLDVPAEKPADEP